jgi:beta-lactamase regulating signal transducer with metallopeptidase domain
VAGFLRPVLIVPQEAREWDQTTWHCVLAHEAQHIRQGDLWLGWIAHLTRVFYWWHPLAWSLTRRMGLECEACCDDAVLRLGVRAADYARVLLGFTNVDPRIPAPVFSIQGRTPSSLCHRVERLLTGGAVTAPAWRAFALATLLIVGVGSCFWLGFERAPHESQAELKGEVDVRWAANPFPGDSP